jgi:His/Glu/Gln/Arg/opine family amino acid ABC transporter permease subunit
MTTLSEDARNTVNYEEPATKPPPLLAVGPLAWARRNLFGTWLDAVLTIVFTVATVAIVSSFVSWAVGAANWFSVTFNLRLLMVGRYPPEAEWRVQVLALLTAFAAGMALAAWARLSRGALIAMIALLAALFIVPVVVDATISPPPSYVLAGNEDVKVGSATETPQTDIGFIAKAGETVTIKLASQFSVDDTALNRLYSFSDKAANLLRSGAEDRLSTQERIDEINSQLAGDLLTDNQRKALTTELGKLKVAEPVTQTYAVNQVPVKVQLLKGAALEPVAEATLTADAPTLAAQLPEDGWYVLRKTVEGSSKGVVLLQGDGMLPLLENNFVRGAEVDDQGNVTSTGGRGSEYIRVMDNFHTQAERPSVDGKNVPMLTVIDAQYRGDRPLADYLRVYLSPFLRQINFPLLLLFVVFVAGYSGGRLVDQRFSPPERPRRASGRIALWLLVTLPILMFALVYGMGNILPLTDTRRWGGLLLTLMLTVVGIIASFPIGILLALGRRSKLPVIRTVCTIYIEAVRGVPLITVLFMAQLLVPLVNPSLAEFPNVFRAMVGIVFFSAAYLAENVRGGLQSIPPGQEEAAKALGLNAAQVVLFVTLPQALRAVIPALVGQCISLFKDTSLVAIVGLLDLTGISANIVAQVEFLGRRREVFLFIAVVYFVFSYIMAAVARRIEESGAGAAASRRI